VRLPFDYSESILVVDDDAVMVDLITRHLQRIGFKDVDSTTDGLAALNMVRDKRYRLVISDLNMEPLGGLQLLRSVRTDRTLASTRFMMATGDLKTESVTAARRLGVNSYLLKPFSRGQLQTKLVEALGGH
jgi:two-component system, chemotaxis family, chemotaxis protein CheY